MNIATSHQGIHQVGGHTRASADYQSRSKYSDCLLWPELGEVAKEEVEGILRVSQRYQMYSGGKRKALTDEPKQIPNVRKQKGPKQRSCDSPEEFVEIHCMSQSPINPVVHFPMLSAHGIPSNHISQRVENGKAKFLIRTMPVFYNFNYQLKRSVSESQQSQSFAIRPKPSTSSQNQQVVEAGIKILPSASTQFEREALQSKRLLQNRSVSDPHALVKLENYLKILDQAAQQEAQQEGASRRASMRSRASVNSLSPSAATQLELADITGNFRSLTLPRLKEETQGYGNGG